MNREELMTAAAALERLLSSAPPERERPTDASRRGSADYAAPELLLYRPMSETAPDMRSISDFFERDSRRYDGGEA